MNLFRSLFGQKKKGSAALAMRETLFGDQTLEQWPPVDADINKFPGDVFASARRHITAGEKPAAISCWQSVIAHPGLESRAYLQAWHFLRMHGEKPPANIAKDVLGVVYELGTTTGLMILAIYPDHTAHYYGASDGDIVWEYPDPAVDEVIEKILSLVRKVVIDEKPARKKAEFPPEIADTRVTFLTPSAIYYETVSNEEIMRNTVGKVLMGLAFQLIALLKEKVKTQSLWASGKN